MGGRECSSTYSAILDKPLSLFYLLMLYLKLFAFILFIVQLVVPPFSPLLTPTLHPLHPINAPPLSVPMSPLFMFLGLSLPLLFLLYLLPSAFHILDSSERARVPWFYTAKQKTVYQLFDGKIWSMFFLTDYTSLNLCTQTSTYLKNIK